MSYVLDDLDRRIVKATQAGLPLCAEPYQAVAAEVGCSAADVMTRLANMLDAGAIRRIGVVPNHYKLGYTAVQPPFFMRKDVMGKVAELKDYDESLYRIVDDPEKPEIVLTVRGVGYKAGPP